MPLVPPILPPLDIIRGIGGVLGMRPFKVTVRRRVWSGPRPGAPGSTKVDTDVVLTNRFVDGTLQPVMVKQVSRAEAIASGGIYTNRDLKVGPITPSFASGAFGPAAGFDDASIDPAPTGQAVQIIWIVASPKGSHGMPAAGIVCEKIGEEATSMHYYAVLRATGR
jgi:hypothetical protein